MPEIASYIILYILVFLFGVVIGSFLNVCIFRIPQKESIVLPHSHCMSCGYQLCWYDLVPLFSFLFLRGRCRKCHTKLSLQYPLVEGLNGALYVIVFLANGWNLLSVLYCLLTSALIVLSVIDFRTMEIPNGINVFIFLLGVAATAIDRADWRNHVIGMVAVSGFLLFIYLVTVGRGIGGGDIKLMAGAGLLLGWKAAILAFFLGCILGSVIHVMRMKINNAEHRLAMGPYLSVGIWLTAMWGQFVIEWYFGLLGF
ncbi:MAG: prepilin peptidase [Lachnospiraceae bacterium]|nr:prepilin peptidase [Lachnospiraceae bacterium]